MKGSTHILFGIGLISLFLSIVQTPFILWGIGTLIIAPIFSRIPDYDQKIAKITFNQVIPHRGKLSHNLLYGLPIFSWFYLSEFPLLQMVIISSFGALFIHVLVDAFNAGGVWLGFFHLSLAKFRWDSVWGNSLFKLMGVMLLSLSIYLYL